LNTNKVLRSNRRKEEGSKMRELNEEGGFESVRNSL
jgi:hypothetical protein